MTITIYQQTKLLKQNYNNNKNSSSSNYAQICEYIKCMKMNTEWQFIQMRINLSICMCAKTSFHLPVRVCECKLACLIAAQKSNVYEYIGPYPPYNGRTYRVSNWLFGYLSLVSQIACSDCNSITVWRPMVWRIQCTQVVYRVVRRQIERLFETNWEISAFGRKRKSFASIFNRDDKSFCQPKLQFSPISIITWSEVKKTKQKMFNSIVIETGLIWNTLHTCLYNVHVA